MSGAHRPSWLPETIPVGGEWHAVLKRLYAVFEADFKRQNRRYEGLKIVWDDRVLPGESYEEGFWHLITRYDRDQGERLVDTRRAERLPWCAPTIDHADDSAVTTWDHRERGGVRTYLWLREFDYVIVLQKRPRKRIAVLVTAFHVTGASSRRGLEHKYERRL